MKTNAIQRIECMDVQRHTTHKKRVAMSYSTSFMSLICRVQDIWSHKITDVCSTKKHGFTVASSPGSLLKNGGRREPGNIRGRSCQLLVPCCGCTNQIAEQNYMYMWHFVHSAKICQLGNGLISVDYTSKVGEKQFSDGRGASPESPRSSSL